MRARIEVVHRVGGCRVCRQGVGIVLVTVPKRPVGTDCGGAPSSDAANLPLPLWKPYSLMGLSPLSWQVIRSAPEGGSALHLVTVAVAVAVAVPLLLFLLFYSASLLLAVA